MVKDLLVCEGRGVDDSLNHIQPVFARDDRVDVRQVAETLSFPRSDPVMSATWCLLAVGVLLDF